MGSIRILLLLIINALIVLVVTSLSLIFYQEFRMAIDERVLLQLSSIRNLKSIQIENYLRDQASGVAGGAVVFQDITNSHSGKTTLVWSVKGDTVQHLIDFEPIQQILLERTGMGESGESYLVGANSRLRSKSRFFQQKQSYLVLVNTEASLAALAGETGTAIIDDYRSIPVYSAYSPIAIEGLQWAILSEIDVDEVTAPLIEMRSKLILAGAFVIVLGVILSLIITGVLSKPMQVMRQFLKQMSIGHFDFQVEDKHYIREVNEMFQALKELQHSIRSAIAFSEKIGERHLDAHYELSSPDDQLGLSLIHMKHKLRAYESKALAAQNQVKRSLVTGQENERKRLARELHDGLGPLLTSLKLTLNGLQIEKETKEKVDQMVNDTVKEIRRMTYDLMPLALLDFGVGKAFENFVHVMRMNAPIEIRYEDGTLGEETQISDEMSICVYRVCQELLNNGLRHAQATVLALSLTEFDDRVSVYYHDDGVGFDKNVKKSGSGLQNIEERISMFDGYLQIETSTNGTTIEIEIPIS